MATPHRRIKSYVLRQGRLTRAQQVALDTQWSQSGIDYNAGLLDWEAVFNNRQPVTLEIGFGNGESLLQQALSYADKNYVGIEVHRPGVGHLLHRISELQLKHPRDKP
jgi:tRNA (guanine-N7-)-methyltransferase